MSLEDVQHAFKAYPAKSGHYSPVTGKVDPLIRCAFCNTYVLWRGIASRATCDCTRTYVTATETAYTPGVNRAD